MTPYAARFGIGYPHFAGAVFEIPGELALDRFGGIGRRNHFDGNQGRAFQVAIRIGARLLFLRDNTDIRLQPLIAAGAQPESDFDENQQSAHNSVLLQGCGDAVLDQAVLQLGWRQCNQFSIQELAFAGRVGKMLELLKSE